MSKLNQRTERRTEALSKERIIDAAIDILDTNGERSLTFRTLAKHLSTGAGAIYWHVANKEELLTAATSKIVEPVLRDLSPEAHPRDVITSIAIGIFDAIDAHPWVGAQLSDAASQPTSLRLFERMAMQLVALGVPSSKLLSTVSALFNFIEGVGLENAVNARKVAEGADRDAVLGTIADYWLGLDPVDFPLSRLMAEELRHHDDRQQFLDGINLILAGIEYLYSTACAVECSTVQAAVDEAEARTAPLRRGGRTAE